MLHNSLFIVRIRIFGGGYERSIDLIPPGHTVRRSFWFHCDGQLEFCATSGTTTISEIIEGYVTGNQGGYTTVTINPDKTISIIHGYD
jgi:hypothetical protein